MRAIENYRTGSSQRCLCPLKPDHAVAAGGAGQLAFVVQGMQVGQGFAHGKGKLMQVELALEHDRDDVRYALRLGTSVEHFLQTLGMMRMLLAYTFVHSPKRAAVGRQYQKIGRAHV